MLIDENREMDFNLVRVARDLYEMPEYKEEYSENEILEYLKSQLGNTVGVTFLGDEGICFKLRENEKYFKFEKALKVGKEYFKLEKIRKTILKILGGINMNEKQPTQEMIEKGLVAIDACDDYFNVFANEYGKSGFIWLEHNETGQLVVYTRGEYKDKIKKFLSTLQ